MKLKEKIKKNTKVDQSGKIEYTNQNLASTPVLPLCPVQNVHPLIRKS